MLIIFQFKKWMKKSTRKLFCVLQFFSFTLSSGSEPGCPGYFNRCKDQGKVTIGGTPITTSHHPSVPTLLQFRCLQHTFSYFLSLQCTFSTFSTLFHILGHFLNFKNSFSTFKALSQHLEHFLILSEFQGDFLILSQHLVFFLSFTILSKFLRNWSTLSAKNSTLHIQSSFACRCHETGLIPVLL